MEPVTDDQNGPANGAHELLARLYREIGVAAVARALAEPFDGAPTPLGTDCASEATVAARAA